MDSRGAFRKALPRQIILLRWMLHFATSKSACPALITFFMDMEFPYLVLCFQRWGPTLERSKKTSALYEKASWRPVLNYFDWQGFSDITTPQSFIYSNPSCHFLVGDLMIYFFFSSLLSPPPLFYLLLYIYFHKIKEQLYSSDIVQAPF